MTENLTELRGRLGQDDPTGRRLIARRPAAARFFAGSTQPPASARGALAADAERRSRLSPADRGPRLTTGRARQALWEW